MGINISSVVSTHLFPVACLLTGVLWLVVVYHWESMTALRFRLRPFVGARVQVIQKGAQTYWIGKVSRVDRKYAQVYVDVELGDNRWMSNWFRFDQVRFLSSGKPTDVVDTTTDT